jgi:hypothetical protein
MFCNKKTDTDNFHPLNYQHLKIAKEKDKTIQNIQKCRTLYVLKDFHGGGKVTKLVGYNEKIVIPGLLQKQISGGIIPHSVIQE